MQDPTTVAIERQIRAMGSGVFELGLFRPDGNGDGDGPPMLPRTWDVAGLMRSIGWLRLQNARGRNIYIRAKGEHDLSLVDDLSRDAVDHMKSAGFRPAVVVETSPGNFQAWLKHPEVLPKDLGTATARALAREFGGDLGAADWRHFGRLAGFTNRKPKYCGADGMYPYVRVIEADGGVYPAAAEFLRRVRTELDAAALIRRQRGQSEAERSITGKAMKSIDAFRLNPTYGGDNTRVDLAYAVYALSHGVADVDVKRVLSGRDLSHKGGARRQEEYVERTVAKALRSLDGRGR